jgi:hypothetical protein
MDPWPWRLEKAVLEANELSLDLPDLPRRISTANWTEKVSAFDMLTRYVHRSIPANRHVSEMLLPRTRVSDEALLAEEFADWTNFGSLLLTR